MTLKTGNQQRKSTEPKDQFFQNINKIDEPLARHKLLISEMKSDTLLLIPWTL